MKYITFLVRSHSRIIKRFVQNNSIYNLKTLCIFIIFTLQFLFRSSVIKLNRITLPLKISYCRFIRTWNKVINAGRAIELFRWRETSLKNDTFVFSYYATFETFSDMSEYYAYLWNRLLLFTFNSILFEYYGLHW